MLVDHYERVAFATVGPDGRRVVVKADRDGRRLQMEAEVMMAARQAAIPAPMVHDLIDGDPQIIVMEYIDGRTVWESADTSWHVVGRHLRRLHEVLRPPAALPMFGDGGPTWWQSLARTAEREVDAAGTRTLLPPGLRRHLGRLLEQAFDRDDEIRLVPIHGDCTPYHWLLRDDDVVGLIDFGESGLGEPAWDLVTLTRWDPEELPRVLDGYGASPAFAAHVHNVFMPYSTLRSLVALNWLVRHGRDASPNVFELMRVASP
jgi:aminoglycoside phosphotransferase (APT) family kinase protein